VHPLSPLKNIWDNAMAMAIAYCVLSALVSQTNYNTIAQNENIFALQGELFFDADAAGIWLLLELTVDALYALDMLLTFRTGKNQQPVVD
jgi:hypothetical protein